MKKLFLIITILSASTFSADAQFGEDQFESVTVLNNPNEVNIYAMDCTEYGLLDTAHLLASYVFRYKQAHRDVIPKFQKTVLQIGTKFIYFYPQSYRYIDSLLTLSAITGGLKIAPSAFLIPTGEIYQDLQRGITIVLQRIPAEKKYIAQYEEPTPKIEWQLTVDTITLMGYLCHKAYTTFRGRNWTAWFTTDIPVGAGPWKLQGLPGLILKAEESEGDYGFTCTELIQEIKPILWYHWPYKEMTREKWQKIEQSYHAMPLLHLGQFGKNKFFTRNSERELDATWKIENNPIEKE